jgi:hypothetical protein
MTKEKASNITLDYIERVKICERWKQGKMTKNESLKLALNFIERVNKDGWILADFKPEMHAIKEALKQSKPKPVGKFARFTDGIWREVTDGSAGIFLYTAPPQPKEEDNDGRC